MKARRVRTPSVLQMEAVECGAASLGMILAYYGKRVPLEELRVACGVTRDGSTAGNVVRAARAYGLTATGYRRDVSDLETMPLPFVIFWQFNHFLVVEGFSKRGVHLNDPATGRRVVDDEEFDRSYTGVAIAFEPAEGFVSESRTTAAFGSILKYLAVTRPAIAYAFGCGLALIVPGLLIPAFVRVFVDNVLLAGDRSFVPIVVIGILVTLALEVAVLELQERVMLRVQTKLAVTSASRFMSRLLDLPMSFFAQRSPGELSYRVGLNDRVAELLSQRILSTVVGLVATLFFLGMMIYFDVGLALVVLAMTALNIGALMAVARSRSDDSASLLHEEGRLGAQVADGLASIETLKAGGAEEAFFRRWSGQQARVLNIRQRFAMPTQILNAVPQLTAALTTVAILAIGGWRVIDGTLSIGTLLAFQLLAGEFAAPFSTIVELGADLQSIGVTIRRLDDVTNYKSPPTADPATIVPLPPIDVASRIDVRGVTFTHSPVSKPSVSEVSFIAEPGRWIALVGATGSGKSSIVRLLVGLDVPTSGEIALDDVTYDRIEPATFARRVAFVDQNITLFPGSVRDNITLWDATIDDAAVERAARDAVIHDEILARPGAYDGLVAEDGTNMSGGQRQRLEIARALSRDPTVLVLDEATSALDATTEFVLAENLRRRGCTCVLVAHRLSTIRDCDEILVVDEGVVVERGRHEELVALRGRYFALVSAS
jgi:NHLM bacteriocin system ABC transporter peptidase/ATP-binding protein